MTRNPFGHIDLRVRSVDEALPFYEALLPELGFVHRYHGGRWKVWGVGADADLPGAAYFADPCGNRLDVYPPARGPSSGRPARH